jgi:16S rRNA C1402 N4-methylase RsmH
MSIPNPPDVPLCVNHLTYGHCHTLVSNKSTTIDDKHPLVAGSKDTYATTVAKSILMPAQSFAAIKAWIENVCHRVSCKNGIGSWDKVVQDLGSDKE